MRASCVLALLFAAAAGWESGKTCTTDDVRTLAKKDAKLSGTALAECVILDLRGETIAPEMLPRQVVVRTGDAIHSELRAGNLKGIRPLRARGGSTDSSKHAATAAR